MINKGKDKDQTRSINQTATHPMIARSTSRQKKNWLPYTGGFLIVSGLVIFAATTGLLAAKWVLGLWPLFALIAGVAAVMGFAVERRPRSPLGGMLLIFIGVLFLAGRVHANLNALQIYGRYWIVLVAIFAVIELVRFYSHRQADGKPPKLFTLGKILALLFFVGTGAIANQASNNPQVLGALSLPKWLDFLRDPFIGDPYRFTDESIAIADLPPSSRVTINNGYGDVRILGVSGSPKATLIKEVRAWSSEDAQQIADQIQLKIDRNPDGSFTISTNRNQIQATFKTNIELQLPITTNVAITNSYGTTIAQNFQNKVSVISNVGNVEASNLTGDVDLTLKNSDQVTISQIKGKVKVNGAKNIRLTDVRGDVQLNGQRGSLELSQVTGELNIVSPFSEISVQTVAKGVSIKTEHGSVKINDTGGADIDAPHSDISAARINGDLKVQSVHSNIKTSNVSGTIFIDAEHANIVADNLQGPATIETTYGEVSVKNFHDSLIIKTSFDGVKLSPAPEFVGDINVENSRGDIDLALPQSGNYQIDAESINGRVKTSGLNDTQAIKGRDHFSLSVGMGNGSDIKLRTSFNNITIRGNGSRQAKVEDPVKVPAN